MLQDLIKTERERQIVDLISLATAIGYAHWVALRNAETQVEILRKAYADTMKDPAFLAEATKTGVMLRPMTGAELESF